MQLKFFRIPVIGGEPGEQELNRFLAGHAVAQVERVLIQDGPNSAWALCVTYEDGAGSATTPAVRSLPRSSVGV